MTTDQQRNTNGRVKVEQAISGARETLQQRQKRGFRPGKLLVPVLLAVGVIAIIRKFEQSTGG